MFHHDLVSSLHGMRGRWGTLLRFFWVVCDNVLYVMFEGEFLEKSQFGKLLQMFKDQRWTFQSQNHLKHLSYQCTCTNPFMSLSLSQSTSTITFLNSRRNGAWHHDKNEKYLNKYIVFFFVSIFLAREVGYIILLIQVFVGDSSTSRACWYFAFKYANATSIWNFIHAIEAGILVWVWGHVENGSWKCSITYNLMLICRASQ